jgi:hypothetical protein
MASRRQHLLFPLGVAVYLVSRLVANDADPLPWTSGLRALAVMVVLVMTLLWLLRPLLPAAEKRSLLVGTFLFLFFSYTPWLVRSQLAIRALGANDAVARWSTVIAAAAPFLLLSLTVYVIHKSQSNARTAIAIANIVVLVFLGFSVVALTGPYATGTVQRWRGAADSLAEEVLLRDISPGRDLPDIYYVILDGYARADVLKEVYTFDNSPFIRYLEDRGFFVPTGSRSNYMQTYLSLASSLNLSYLDELQRVMGGSRNKRPLQYLIQERSAAAELLKRAGYRYMFFGSRYSASSFSAQADVCHCGSAGLNDLENKLILFTPLILVRSMNAVQHRSHAGHILRTFRDLSDASVAPGPKVVFAHVLAPHPPFVFGPHGESVVPDGRFFLNDGNHYLGSRQGYVRGYRDQVAFVNTKIRETVDAILSRSSREPVIILQADHGPGSELHWESIERTNTKERTAIFAAYHLPAGARARFYETITPVNALRIVFDDVLGTRFATLPDRSFYTPWKEPYGFVEVPQEAALDGGVGGVRARGR